MANAVDSMYLNDFLARVGTVVKAGGSTTTEYSRVVNRWHEFLATERTAAERLGEAVTGDADITEVNTLQALALAEKAGPQPLAEVRNAVADVVFTVVQGEYAKVAEANYNTIRQQFDSLAESFTKLCKTVDPDADPVTLMEASDAQRKAWAAAAIEAPRLDAMIPNLQAAAALAGLTLRGNDSQLALTVNPGKNHRRRIWDAWENTGNSRGGRWAALLKAGASIGTPELTGYKAYARPEDPQWKAERGQLGIRQVSVDPADTEYEANQKAAAA